MRFRPWVGVNYLHGAFFGQRLLLVGESHHHKESTGEPDSETTCSVVEDAARFPLHQDYAFFTKIAQALVGERSYAADPIRFWHSVAFVNYVQVSLLNRRRPTKEEWRAAEEPFRDTLDLLKPHRVIAFGRQTWDWMPPFVKDSDFNYDSGATDAWGGMFPVRDSVPAKAMWTYHPTGVWNWDDKYWREKIGKFLLG
jgi:hypothetical protein